MSRPPRSARRRLPSIPVPLPGRVRREIRRAQVGARRASVRVLTQTARIPVVRPVAQLGMRTLFDGLSGHWEQIRADPTYRAGLREALTHLPRGFRPRQALDVACGTGLAAGVLLERWPELVVRGTDISPRMVARASELVPDATFEIAPAHRQPYPDAAFDLVVTLDGLLDLPELLRVTHRKGRILIAYSRQGTTPISRPVDEVAASLEALGARATTYTDGQAHVVIARHAR